MEKICGWGSGRGVRFVVNEELKLWGVMILGRSRGGQGGGGWLVERFGVGGDLGMGTKKLYNVHNVHKGILQY